MNFNIILASSNASLSAYIPYIIAIVAVLAVICLLNWYKSKKAEDHYLQTLNTVKKGTKVRTMFGLFGEVQEFKDVGDTRIVLLKVYDGTLMEVDARAIYEIDSRATILETKETFESSEEEIQKPKRTRKTKSE